MKKLKHHNCVKYLIPTYMKDSYSCTVCGYEILSKKIMESQNTIDKIKFIKKCGNKK